MGWTGKPGSISRAAKFTGGEKWIDLDRQRNLDRQGNQVRPRHNGLR